MRLKAPQPGRAFGRIGALIRTLQCKNPMPQI